MHLQKALAKRTIFTMIIHIQYTQIDWVLHYSLKVQIQSERMHMHMHNVDTGMDVFKFAVY